MTKRSKSEDEEGYSGQENADESTPPPPPKKAKKTTAKRTPKPKNTTKESSPSGSSSKKGGVAKLPDRFIQVFTNSDGEKFVDLGKKKRVTVRTFKGAVLVDIREFYGKDDDLQPGKKGISLSPEQWAELKANANTIDSLVQKLQTP